MKLIVGLGNPGPKYRDTRHNVGWMVLQRLSRQWSIGLGEQFCQSQVGQAKVYNEEVGLALPETFMNASGEAVTCLLKKWRLTPASLLVVCDDLSLPLGMIRLRAQGSEGGHRGLASVLEKTGTLEVPRLRLGIERKASGKDLPAYVLDRFDAQEQSPLDESLKTAVKACEAWVQEGITAAMNRFNKKISGA